MIDTIDTGEDIMLSGKSGAPYAGKIYSDKDFDTALTGKNIVCLTNSSYTGNEWHHKMNSIYLAENVKDTILHFKERDDISHLILIPWENESGVDIIADLIQNYLHS